MEFVNLKLMIASLVIIVLFSLLVVRLKKKFILLVSEVWGFKERFLSKIAIIFYLLAFTMFGIALGDLRGPEEVVESNIPNQRTLILIDNSASMLVEDIRPNRISKAAILAKHFVKNAYGHQVSLSIFSDIQRKIVPFTDDMDILESRLGTMLAVQPQGGSNVSLALKEAFQYFKTSDGYSKGNILLITDGEEHGGVDVKIPESISLAVVGIGTEDGGKIPERNSKGNFLRYKKFNGVEIVSKMSKKFFEGIVENSKYSKVWFVESYSLPTSEVLSFFKGVHLNSFSKGSFRSRPVYGYWLIIIAIIFYIVFVILGRFRNFKSIASIVLLFSILTLGPNIGVYAQQIEEEVKVDPYQQELIDRMRSGEISRDEKLKLGELFLKQKDGHKQASQIYSETLEDYDAADSKDLFNYATALLKDNKFNDSMKLFRYVKERNLDDKNLVKSINDQVKLALNKQEQKKKEEKKKKDNKDDKDKKKKKDDKSQKGKNKKDKKDKKDQQSKEGKEQQKKDKKSSKNKNKPKDKKESGKENKPKNGKKKEKSQQQQWKEMEDGLCHVFRQASFRA